ncbi:MAG: toprim domain-containing protein [Thermoplasmata archaeon]|nr:toprim domain-containing protein [Thermoplasmata archaeon]
MDYEETLEEILDLIEELANQSDVPIIVEGRKDVRALEKLGIEGLIIVLNDGLSIIDTCTKLSEDHKKAIILTDWDRKGGQLARLLMDALEANGMKYNTDIRAGISRLSKKDIKDIESLPRFLARLRGIVETGIVKGPGHFDIVRERKARRESKK